MDSSKALRFLRADGRRITRERKLLLRIIERNPHLDAAEIYELARKENPKISLSTVYRTVNLLRDLGLVEANSLGEDHYHYEVRFQEHYHLVCLGCGRVIEIPPSEVIKQLGQNHGFEIIGVKLELFGYCPECRKKSGSELNSHFTSNISVDKVIDLRGMPVLEHPGIVAREVQRAHSGDLIEIITDDPNRARMAPKMLQEIKGLELLAMWQEDAVCHALVKRVNR